MPFFDATTEHEWGGSGVKTCKEIRLSSSFLIITRRRLAYGARLERSAFTIIRGKFIFRRKRLIRRVISQAIHSW